MALRNLSVKESANANPKSVKNCQNSICFDNNIKTREEKNNFRPQTDPLLRTDTANMFLTPFLSLVQIVSGSLQVQGLL